MKLNKITFDNYKNLAKEFSFEQANNYVALIGGTTIGILHILSWFTIGIVVLD